MKVLVFTTQFYRLGSAEGLQLDLAQRLNARDIRVDVLSLYRHDLPGVPEATEALKIRGVPRIGFLGLVPHPSMPSLLMAAWRLRRLVAREGYDIVETSGPTPTALAILALQGTKARHVAGIHQVFRTDRDRNSNLRALRHIARLDWRSRYYAVSRAAADGWTGFANVAARRILVVYNGVADQFFGATTDRDRMRESLGIPPNARMALYVGRLAKYKGIATILEALLPILKERNLVLCYAGEVDSDVPGSAEEVRALKATVERAGLSKRVRWLGHRTDVNQILRSADVLVHPTSVESFGLVLVEALAAGVPIVSSDVEGIPEVLAGTESMMVRPGDAIALREAVEVTLARPREDQLRAERLGIARAEAFRADRRVDEMLRLFQDAQAGIF